MGPLGADAHQDLALVLLLRAVGQVHGQVLQEGGGWRERINRGGSVAAEKGFFVRPPSHPGCSSHCLEQIGLCCSLLHKLTENRFVDDLSKLGPSRGRREFGKRIYCI